MAEERGWHGRRAPAPPFAIFVGLIQVLGTLWSTDKELTAGAVALLLAGPAALLLRRRYPVAVLAVAAGAAVTYAVLDYPGAWFLVSAVVALIGAVRTDHGGPAAGIAVVGFVTYLVLDWPGPIRAIITGIGILILLAFSEGIRLKSKEFAQGARVRAEEARARTEQRRRQASEERLRIAQELHDVIGHHLSLINVQAGVGLHLMDNQPEQARTSLAAIKEASAEALREVRAVLGALQPDDETAPRAPAPSLDRLAELCATAGAALDVRGTESPLPPEVDRAAYRIVREALTNVRRHAGPEATATVVLEYAEETLTISVVDDGTAQPSTQDSDGGGAGIPGMRERATALGGTFTAGPRPAGGFEVKAVLPW